MKTDINSWINYKSKYPSLTKTFYKLTYDYWYYHRFLL